MERDSFNFDQLSLRVVTCFTLGESIDRKPEKPEHQNFAEFSSPPLITRDREDRKAGRSIRSDYLLSAKTMITVASNYMRVLGSLRGHRFRGKRQVIGLTGRK